MVLNRRAMLSASVGAIALGLSGCAKKTKTTVVFINGSALAVSVFAEAGGETFNKKNVQPGHKVQQVYLTNSAAGTAAPVTSGAITISGKPPISIVGAALIVGKTNIITLTISPLGIPSVSLAAV